METIKYEFKILDYKNNNIINIKIFAEIGFILLTKNIISPNIEIQEEEMFIGATRQ